MDFDRQFNSFRRHIDRMFDDFNSRMFMGYPAFPMLPTEDLLQPALMPSTASSQGQQKPGASNQDVSVQPAGGANQQTQVSASTPSSSLMAWTPMASAMKVDVIQDKDSYTVVAEVPGMNKDELKIQVKDDVLTISGERKHELREEDQQRKYVRMERSYGSVSRSLRLPKGCDSHAVAAKHENGVVKITIPFRPELSQERHIAIA